MQPIYYNIGDHIFKLLVPDTQKAQLLLPSFSSFICNPQNADGQNLLFTLFAIPQIIVPEANMVDEMQREDMYSQVYKHGNATYILAKKGNIRYKLKASSNWSLIETDITFTKDYEIAFINQFLVTVFGMASASLKTLKVHASVIEKNGKALLFTAPSGTGKSTHSRLWLQHVPGATLLNDDEPIVRIMDDGQVRVYGAPWSGSTPCYRNASAEVAGIVHLYQSPENKLTLLQAPAAVPALMKQCAVFRSDTENKAAVANTVFDIVSKIPVYRLDCRPDKGAVDLTEPLIARVI